MKKKEIFLKLDELNLDKKEYIIIGDTALVCLGLKKEEEEKEYIKNNKKNYIELNG